MDERGVASGRAARQRATRPVSTWTRPTTARAWRTATGPGDVPRRLRLHRRLRLPRAAGRRAARPCAWSPRRRPVAGARRNLELNGVAGRAEIAAGQRLRRAAPPRSRARALRPGRARSPTVRPRPDRARRPRCAATRRSTCARSACSHPAAGSRRSPARITWTRRPSRRTCREAADDAGVRLRVLERLAQAPDHPVLLTVPETRYLKGLLLQALLRPATRRASRRA